MPKRPTRTKYKIGKETQNQPICALRGDGAERGSCTRTPQGGVSLVPIPRGSIPAAGVTSQTSKAILALGCWWGDAFLRLRNCI